MTRDSSKKVLINILNYNTYEKTDRCIESCLSQENVYYDVLLIDNKSSDDSLIKLKRKYGNRILYLENEINFGYAKGNNLGVDYSLQHGYGYSLILNSDTALSTSNTLSNLMSIMSTNNNCSIIAPTIFNVTPNGLVLNQNDSTYLKLLRYFGILPHNKMIKESLYEISECQGSALLVKNQDFIKVGGFPEHYFMYGEEGTLAKKILWSGKKILWVRDELNYVLHYHDKSGYVDAWRVFLMGRNRTIEYLENRKRYPIKWRIVFWLSSMAQIIKKNKQFIKGVVHALKLIKKNSNKNDLLTDGREAIERIGK